MIINTSAIPHIYRNRFLRATNSNFSVGGSSNISNSSSSSEAIGNTFEPHYLWGQYFDDTEDISGDLTCDGTVTAEKVISPLAQLDRLISDNVTVNGKLTTNQLQAVSGYIQNLLSDSITTDYLTVTKAAHFFKLIIDEIKATQGSVIITPCNAKLDKVEELESDYRCYFRANDADGNQIYNSFEVDDQVVCQTFNAAVGTSYDVSNKYYWRKVTATGSTTTNISGQTVDVHYIDLSKTDCDTSSMTPSVSDEVVLLGNRTDETRQAAIVISAYNSEFLDKGIKAPSIVQYSGINDYNLSNHRLNILSNGLNEFRGGYYNNNGKNVETIISETASTLDGKVTAVSGVVSSHTTSISNLQQTDSAISGVVSSNTSSIGTLQSNLESVSGVVSGNSENIAALQLTASGLTSTVSSHTQSITTINTNVSSVSGAVDSVSGAVSTIESDYVTSSELEQTASSLTSTIQSDYNTKIDSVSGAVSSNTSNISTLQQTASGLSSTVSSHTQSISGLSGDVGTIKSDYVTSSNLQQTASGISATVTSDIEGKLRETGIYINDKKIKINADNTELTSSSGEQTWLVGKNTDGGTIFKLGRWGNSQPRLDLQASDSTYCYFRPTDISMQSAGSGQVVGAGMSVSDGYPQFHLVLGGNTFAIRISGTTAQWKFGAATASWHTFGNSKNTRKVSTNTTLNADDEIVFVTASCTVTLPSSGNYEGRELKIICRQPSISISGNMNGSSQTIGNNHSNQIFELIYDGSTWITNYQNVP